MTKNSELVLRCSGMTCGDVVVPAFEISEGLACGISVPTGFGEDWTLLMKTLSGELENPGIQLFNPGVVVCPQLGCQQFSDDTIVGKSLKNIGLSETDYDAIHANGRVKLSTTIGQLPATSKLAINILGSLRTSSVVVFSTAGLDPNGINAINQIVASSQVTSLHLFATSLSWFYCESDLFDYVVECRDAN